MKVLIIFSSGKIGGAEKSLTLMSHYSNKNLGCNYDLASIGGEGEWSDWARSLNFYPRLSKPGKGGIRDIIEITKFIKNSKFDIVYAIGLRVSVILRIIKFLFKMKFILIHGVRWVPSGNNILDFSTRFVEKYFSLLIDGYITNSKACRNVLEKDCLINNSKLFTIYNGVSNEKTIKTKIKRKKILTVANLSPRKGYLEYLKVIKKVNQKYPDASFHFIGLDNMSGAVSKAIKENNLSHCVSYLGFIKDIKKELLSSYLFVLPSLYSEGCPTSIMEAMQYKIPCVAYDICGINELIIDKKTGLLAKKDDQEMLAESICELITNKVLYHKMSIASEERIKNYFTLESCSKNHLKTFSELYNKIN